MYIYMLSQPLPLVVQKGELYEHFWVVDNITVCGDLELSGGC